ncbi:hypothetical protein [Halomarina pelagica]|uniref:hypothetical protein n=1 Tax=Halomarina pelagica TaxID=2961599 RepID=UPI0020C2208F|nr:hypothetical protein [Halomarina sp. BND7]
METWWLAWELPVVYLLAYALVGLVSVTVEANCTPPPTELTFQHVSTDSRRVGRSVCPPGTTDPGVSVSSWARR